MMTPHRSAAVAPFSRWLRPGLLLAASLLGALTRADALRLPHLLSDGAVVQRDEPIPVWGWADPGAEVVVALGGESRRGYADPDGRWAVTFPARPAGGAPFTLEVRSGDATRVARNLLAGDVWLCSGQSNMVLPMERVKERFADAIAASANPRIRCFTVPVRYAFEGPREEVAGGAWQEAGPDEVLDFSAVGYFFARALEAETGVPIGLIVSAMGGSPVESWMSEAALRPFPDRLEVAAPFRDPAYIAGLKQAENAAGAAWFRYRDARDEGLRHDPPYYASEYDAGAWPVLQAPGIWDEQGVPEMFGVLWLRKEIELPAALAGRPARLLLGRVFDADVTYVNGVRVGETTYKYPPRRYTVPGGVLVAGRNVLTVRATMTGDRGRFLADKEYLLEVGGETFDLRGAWQWKVGMTSGPQPPSTFVEWQPLALYHAMLAPLHRQPLKGVLWYQGESNTGRAGQYEALLRAMITDWRARWGQPELPFLLVQLANYMEASAEPMESGWAELREAQRRVLSLPHTGMAVTIDVGEWNDIHPLDKQTVGERLALEARRVAYGEGGLLSAGPLFAGLAREGSRLRLRFSFVGEGLRTRDGTEPGGFALAGPDGVFHRAQARVDGETVVVAHPDIAEPRAVRYAWAHNPTSANLVNTAGLPASPFEARVE
jgi:sialate O-acetylesterase